VVVTGGLSGALVPMVRVRVDAVDPRLTLTGLRIIWERSSVDGAPAAGA
jgi:pantothenate kinase type III